MARRPPVRAAHGGGARRRPGARMTRARLAWLGALLLVAAALLAVFAWRQRGPQVDVIEVARGPLQRTLLFSARVATLSRVDVGSTVVGRVAQVAVREGDAVRRGDLLLQLETQELDSALAQARASAQQARARVDGLRSTGRAAAEAQLAQAEASLRAAQQELQRTGQLVAQGFLSAARLDEVRKAVDVARAQQDGARAQLAALGERGAELAQAEAQRAQAEAAVGVAEVRRAQAAVRAPADARVLLRQVEPGQIVQPGSALLRLALAGPTLLEAQVDERFLEQLRVGQPAMVVADAYTGQPFAAEVQSIAPAVDAQRGAVEVKLAPRQAPPDFLREDMTLSVEVLTGERASAVLLPLRALRGAPAAASAAAGSDSVWLLQDGRVTPRAVRLGLRTLDAAEVLDGLAEGAQVVLGGAAEPGQRARARPVAWQPGAGGPRAALPDAGAALTRSMGR